MPYATASYGTPFELIASLGIFIYYWRLFISEGLFFHVWRVVLLAILFLIRFFSSNLKCMNIVSTCHTAICKCMLWKCVVCLYPLAGQYFNFFFKLFCSKLHIEIFKLCFNCSKVTKTFDFRESNGIFMYGYR